MAQREPGLIKLLKTMSLQERARFLKRYATLWAKVFPIRDKPGGEKTFKTKGRRLPLRCHVEPEEPT